MSVHLCVMQGEFDEDLKWPVEATFTIALLNQQKGEDKKCTVSKMKWRKPKSKCFSLTPFDKHSIPWGKMKVNFFIENSKLKNFLHNDTLHFCLKHVSVDEIYSVATYLRIS